MEKVTQVGDGGGEPQDLLEGNKNVKKEKKNNKVEGELWGQAVPDSCQH